MEPSPSAPPDDEAPPGALDLDTRKEIARLRSIMYENSCVRLSTTIADDGRWLTDEYVLLDVTDSPAVAGLEDGQYKLTAGKGLVQLYWQHDDVNGGEPVPRASEFSPDAYFGALADANWQFATPTEWSVAEHPGKAMLFSVPPGKPALMGEETWTTLNRRFEGVLAEYAVTDTHNVFRILAASETGPIVVAYVAGIRCPEGQENIAGEIAFRAVRA